MPTSLSSSLTAGADESVSQAVFSWGACTDGGLDHYEMHGFDVLSGIDFHLDLASKLAQSATIVKAWDLGPGPGEWMVRAIAVSSNGTLLAATEWAKVVVGLAGLPLTPDGKFVGDHWFVGSVLHATTPFAEWYNLDAPHKRGAGHSLDTDFPGWVLDDFGATPPSGYHPTPGYCPLVHPASAWLG
jgi:hypothetical protein